MKINSLHCPVTNALTVLGGKWKINIIFLLSNKTMRFGAIKNTLQGITQQMLSKQLKELEIDGLVNREVKQVMPPKVEYSLTSFGTSLIPILKSLSNWNDKNSKLINLKLNKSFDESRIR